MPVPLGGGQGGTVWRRVQRPGTPERAAEPPIIVALVREGSTCAPRLPTPHHPGRLPRCRPSCPMQDMARLSRWMAGKAVGWYCLEEGPEDLHILVCCMPWTMPASLWT